ncbi:MAG: hypothetical protein H0U31_04620 [Chloroflexia bacterium]|jgi:hypothetical protein|nr:hypothetical protein [Chloroflexia bacterium]
MKRLFAIVAVSLLFSLVAPAAAQDATPETGPSLLAELGYPELRVTSDGATSDMPTELEAGRYHIILENTSEVDIDLEFYQLPEGTTIEDLEAFFAEVSESEGPGFAVPDFFYDMVFNGGATSLAGETGEVVLDLMPGEWVVNLLTYDPETDETADVLNTLTVTGEEPEVEDVAGAIEIVMAEMYFEAPETIVAGPQIWNVVNNGLQVHHVVLSLVPDGTTEAQVLELASSFGPPASPEAGATPVEPALSFEDVEDVFYSLLFSNGQSNWYELDLQPGTYAMLCFMPDPSGTSHVMLGMIEIFTVE